MRVLMTSILCQSGLMTHAGLNQVLSAELCGCEAAFLKTDFALLSRPRYQTAPGRYGDLGV